MEQKTCQEVGINTCKAECCRWVPMHKKFLRENRKYFQRKVYAFADYSDCNNLPSSIIGADLIYPITHITPVIKDGQECVEVTKEMQYCPFLNPETLRCAVYSNRPEICRAYGRCKLQSCALACGFQFGKPYAYPPEKSKEGEMMQTKAHQLLDIAYMYKYEPKLFNEMTANADKTIIKRLIGSIKYIVI